MAGIVIHSLFFSNYWSSREEIAMDCALHQPNTDYRMPTERGPLRQRDSAIATGISAKEAVVPKDRILAEVSHELRAPLASALLGLEELRLDDSISEPSRSTVEMIADHVQFAARLIAELFDTVQAGRRAIALTSALLDLHALVRHAVDDSRQAALSARLEVAMDLGAQRHWVNGDRLRLLQILWNLMNNALKFTPAHGSIHIRTFNTAAPAVIVEVEDTGIGLAARDLKKIFDPFEQAGPGKRRGGLGLGLSLSRELARLHGGDLTARSEGEGRGSVFVLTLPTAREPALDAR